MEADSKFHNERYAQEGSKTGFCVWKASGDYVKACPVTSGKSTAAIRSFRDLNVFMFGA